MKYFTIQELTISNTAQRKGIDNTPDQKAAAALTALVTNVLDPLRRASAAPLAGIRNAKALLPYEAPA